MFKLLISMSKKHHAGKSNATKKGKHHQKPTAAAPANKPAPATKTETATPAKPATTQAAKKLVKTTTKKASVLKAGAKVAPKTPTQKFKRWRLSWRRLHKKVLMSKREATRKKWHTQLAFVVNYLVKKVLKNPKRVKKLDPAHKKHLMAEVKVLNAQAKELNSKTASANAAKVAAMVIPSFKATKAKAAAKKKMVKKPVKKVAGEKPTGLEAMRARKDKAQGKDKDKPTGLEAMRARKDKAKVKAGLPNQQLNDIPKAKVEKK